MRQETEQKIVKALTKPLLLLAIPYMCVQVASVLTCWVLGEVFGD